MIFTPEQVPDRLRADLCIVGSGAGGAMVAMVAAEAGLRVVVLEAQEAGMQDAARAGEGLARRGGAGKVEAVDLHERG